MGRASGEGQVSNWGDGQFDTVELAPGISAALRVTKDGEVEMLVAALNGPVTAGACQLGLGLIEAARRAAEIRVKIEERRRKREERRVLRG